jgi:acetamidase/formamidase
LPEHYRITLDQFHYRWSRSHRPVLSVRDGDKVTFEINDVGSWQLDKNSTNSDVARFDSSKLYPLAGPMFVEDAKPGDALRIEVLEVGIGDFGWSVVLPKFGLLQEFRRPFLYKWDLKNKKFAAFEKGIKIPLNPFCGVLGVAPRRRGFTEVGPPGRHGGNMDVRHLTAGSWVKIPVQVDGALFSAGDVHAAMGDGEVCGSAIECAGTATLRFGVEKEAGLSYPQFFTGGDPRPTRGYHVATGIGPDLMGATRDSVRGMVHYLADAHGLTREEAYVLCSVAADVRVHEVVDAPNWVVGTMISKDIFPH